MTSSSEVSTVELRAAAAVADEGISGTDEAPRLVKNAIFSLKISKKINFTIH